MHGVRNLLYAALFVGLGFSEPHGVLAMAVIAGAIFLLVEVGLEQVVVVHWHRRLLPERVLLTPLTA